MADAYRYARDALHLDFAAATDHSPAVHWEEIAAINERFDAPGSFVTLPAREWSTSAGHANLYLRSDESIATPDREYDWSVPNDRMGFVEVHQTRGNFEADAVDADWRIKTGGSRLAASAPPSGTLSRPDARMPRRASRSASASRWTASRSAG